MKAWLSLAIRSSSWPANRLHGKTDFLPLSSFLLGQKKKGKKQGQYVNMTENTKQQVREFYDQIGWSQAADGLYQNARYEDLRPVSREYIHKCHMRVKRHLASEGDILLDAGSGPVQWPEYLTY